MSQRREKRFRQLERRVSALETEAKSSREALMAWDIEAAVQQRCVDADWEPATNTATVQQRRGLLQRIGQAWRALLS